MSRMDWFRHSAHNHPRWCPWHHHHHRWSLVLFVQDVYIYLSPKENLHMAVTLSVGHTLNMALAFLDQSGNPMLTPPTPDSPPGWTDTTSSTETIVPAASGLSCVGTPVAPGTDTVSVAVVVGGVSFSATLDVTVTAAPQVLTSVAITPTVS